MQTKNKNVLNFHDIILQVESFSHANCKWKILLSILHLSKINSAYQQKSFFVDNSNFHLSYLHRPYIFVINACFLLNKDFVTNSFSFISPQAYILSKYICLVLC